jgi:hypothetical protein
MLTSEVAGEAATPPPDRQDVQPALGLRGLLLVLPIAAAMAIAAGGDGSTLVFAPLITYALPLVAVVAFWWEDWPGTRLRASLSGWANTALIAAGAVVLTGIGQAVAGHLDPVAIFEASPGKGHVPTFPATLPLAGTAFVAVLEITLVGERWPLDKLPRLPAGLIAVVCAWAIAFVVYFTLVAITPPAGSRVSARHGPVPGADLGAALVVISCWQVLVFVVWRGWPLVRIMSRPIRLACAHVLILGGGLLSYAVLHVALGLDSPTIAAVAGCFIASGLLVGVQFENVLHGRLPGHLERLALLLLTIASAAALDGLLTAAADAIHLTRVRSADWVEHASLNALSTSILLHVAVGRRWPFGTTEGGHPHRSETHHRALESERRAPK